MMLIMLTYNCKVKLVISPPIKYIIVINLFSSTLKRLEAYTDRYTFAVQFLVELPIPP